MGNFFAEMLDGFAAGSAEAVSIALFDLTFILFIVAAASYAFYLMRRSNAVWGVGFAGLVAGAALMTVALILRWIAAGWGHPPWTNLYESLVFFSWGLIVSYAVVEWKYRIKVAGAFVVPIVMIALGLASFSGSKEITPLMPALQSIWLHLHVFGASIAYAMFIVAFAFAVLFLFQDKLPLPNFHFAASTACALALVAVSKARVFVLQFPLTKAVFHDGQVYKAQIPGTDPAQYDKVDLPGMGLFMFIVFALFVVSAVINYRKRDAEKEADTKLPFYAHLLPVILMGLALVRLITQSGSFPGFTLKVNTYGFALMAFTWFFAFMTLLIQLAKQTLAEHLPKAKALDTMTYRAVIVAFPILSFVIISGAIWANEAWGRYWGWDPKETSSLVTWIVYLVYLHTRVTKGWMGRKTAYIAVIGFASVVFTYLGVNLVISGLHSYASG
ncbi:MAG: cytochrome c biogenesis protein CcsA [Deltaproteobacteria bacterium]|nr:cytochrome c biogenesis protein CcsA [Deltaproteobacteria bacterium]